MNANHVNNITRSPHYPQSNGLVGKYVQIVKSLFYKAKEEGKDLFKCLVIYCNTPLSGSLKHQCKSCRAEVQDLTYLCLAQLDSSLIYSLKSLEKVTRMNICLHMTYILGKMLCIKMQQASSGINHYYQLMCTTKKLHFNYQGRCHLQEETGSFRALPTIKHRVRR